MNTQEIIKPTLDRSFYEPSSVMSVLNISYGLGLFIIFGWLNYQLAIGSWPIVYKVICMIPCTVLSAIGLYVLATLGHEGIHGTIFKNWKASFLTGLFLSSSILTYFDMGVAVRHWDHHRDANKKNDPDIMPSAWMTKWWQRLLITRVLFNIVYLKYTYNLAIGNLKYVEKHKTPYEPDDLVLFARLNFLFAGIWLGAYIFITYLDWRAGLYGILVPSLVLALLAGCQSYLDHYGLDDGQFTNAYIRTSPLMTFIYFGSNYHLEHHLYPRVPQYRLPKVHKVLLEAGLYDVIKPTIVSGFFEAYKALAKQSVLSAENVKPTEYSHLKKAGI